MTNDPETYTPTSAELKARNKRNLAIAGALFVFVALVFFTMLSRSGAI